MSDALSSWGKKDGAIVVVSHDKSFCDSVGFNAVGTVKDGTLVYEERPLSEKDWKQYDLTATGVEEESEGSTVVVEELTPEQKLELKEKRRKAHNAPKQIAKLEKKIEEFEDKIAGIDDEMMQVGNDVGKLTDLSKEKEKLESKVAEMMQEWEDIEMLLEELNN